MGLSVGALLDIWKYMMPWSAAHVSSGKLVALNEENFYQYGFKDRFKSGDIIFGRTVFQKKYYPVIYAVQAVREYHVDPTMDIVWELKLIGGYGPKEIDIKYADAKGENPSLVNEMYFRDTEAQGWRPSLNFFVEKVVRDGKTIFDLEQEVYKS